MVVSIRRVRKNQVDTFIRPGFHNFKTIARDNLIHRQRHGWAFSMALSTSFKKLSSFASLPAANIPPKGLNVPASHPCHQTAKSNGLSSDGIQLSGSILTGSFLP